MRLAHFEEEDAYFISNRLENSRLEQTISEPINSDTRTANSTCTLDQRDTSADGDLEADMKLSSSSEQEVDREQDVGREHCEGERVSNGMLSVSGEEERRSASFTSNHQVAEKTDETDHVRPDSLEVPLSSQCEFAETDSGITRKAPTEVMSPRSYSSFKNSLVHVPEMNLPWESMRNISQCGCGVTFSFSIRKVSC